MNEKYILMGKVTMTEFEILSFMFSKGKVTSDDLQILTGVDRSGCLVYLQALRSKGYVERKNVQTTKQGIHKHYFLTDEGKKLCREILERLQKGNGE